MLSPAVIIRGFRFLKAGLRIIIGRSEGMFSLAFLIWGILQVNAHMWSFQRPHYPIDFIDWANRMEIDSILLFVPAMVILASWYTIIVCGRIIKNYYHCRKSGGIMTKGIVGIRLFQLCSNRCFNKGFYHKGVFISNYSHKLWSLPCLVISSIKGNKRQSSLHRFMLLASRKIIHIIILFSVCNPLMENSVPLAGSAERVNADNVQFTQEDLLELCLVGTVLTNKAIRFNVLKDMMAKMWQPGQSMDITKIDENRFLFQFYHSWDLERVLEGGPWLYDNFMLVTHKIQFGEDPMTVSLNEVELWVQIHQLPFGFMTEDVGVLIGNHIGKFVGYDAYNNYPVWRKYMRIKVAVNVQTPLKKNWAFDRVKGDTVQLIFKFEKLGTFCFLCGIIGHSEKFCSKRLGPNLPSMTNEWGNFLRAESSALGGNGSENKWLRNSRSVEGGIRSNKVNNINSRMNEEILNRGASDHKLYGRVAIDRDPNSKKLVFFKRDGMNGEATNNWTVFCPTDAGNNDPAVGPTAPGNRDSQNNVTDLAVELAKKMLVSAMSNATGGTDLLAPISSEMQPANNKFVIPSNIKNRDASSELPRATFKVLENSLFLDHGNLNNSAATNQFLLTNGQGSKATTQIRGHTNLNRFTTGENSGIMQSPVTVEAAELSTPIQKGNKKGKCKEAETSWDLGDATAVLDSKKAGPLLRDVLANSPVGNCVAVIDKVKGTQPSINNSKIPVTRISMKNQARRKPLSKGIALSELVIQQDKELNVVKKRFRTDEVNMAEPNEQAKLESTTAIDMMNEDTILEKSAAGTDKSIQHSTDSIVTVILAGTAQQACQDK